VHELSIAEAVVRIAERHAAGRPVTAVFVRVGHLRQVVPSALAFSFQLVAEGTVLDGARLELAEVPAEVRCRACAAQSEPEGFPLTCRVCGGFDTEVIRGEELQVESLEIDERPPDAQHQGPEAQISMASGGSRS
jgi:hydrogenase nickel incorporation protein HypA/HybF